MENQTIQKFCTNELRKDQNFSQKTFVLITNYSLLIKLLIMEIILVGLVHNSQVQLSLLLLLESIYLIYSITKYIQAKHLRSIRFLIPKVIQSLVFIGVFVTMILISWSPFKRPKAFPVST